jgi:hypothetical protein
VIAVPPPKAVTVMITSGIIRNANIKAAYAVRK